MKTIRVATKVIDFASYLMDFFAKTAGQEIPKPLSLPSDTSPNVTDQDWFTRAQSEREAFRDFHVN